ncbi:coiled-coil and C2 domain-containing protein 1-like isoform X3 [Symsagittifera roscoffensis]|uniref:coiled-coil and C2 domain-containing protein 1-like isoform X3 n=1 Tax=Symsagittifera roscoffensis TaxID=84072 RepID=UPI00307C89EA
MFRSKDKSSAPPRNPKSGPLDVASILHEANSLMIGDDFGARKTDELFDAELEAELLSLQSGSDATVTNSEPKKAKQSSGGNNSLANANVKTGQLDFAAILAQASNLLGDHSDQSSEADEDFDAELAALMGGDSANGSDTEDYQTLGSRHKSGVQSADTSPSHRPKQPSADQMPNFLANRPKPVYGNLMEVIDDRLRQYKAALEKAQQTEDSSKIRRYTRQIKTLEDQKRSVNAGKVVKDEDIPPPIAMSHPGMNVQHSPSVGGSPQQHPQASSLSAGGAKGTNSAGPGDGTGTATVPSSSSGSEHSPTTDMLQTGGGGANSQAAVNVNSAHQQQQLSLDSESGGVSSAVDQQTLLLLRKRVHEYKVAAHQANKQGDKPAALKYVRVIKGFEEVISAVETGKSVDISNLPGPPPLVPGGNPSTDPSTNNAFKSPSTDNSSLASAASSDQQQHQSPIRQPPPVPMTSSSSHQLPPHTTNIQQQQQPSSGDENMDALVTRMNVYKEASEKAKQAGDMSKARRQDRLKNQYMDAIKSYRNGRTVDWEGLSNPLGFPPLPNTAAAANSAAAGQSGGAMGGSGQQAADYDPIASLLNAAVQQINNESPQTSSASSKSQSGAPSFTSESSPAAAAVNSEQPPTRAPPPVPPNHPSKQAAARTQPSAANAQAPPNKIQMTVDFLEKRQQQYRSAAIACKKRNDIEEAKRYLKLCKGFDPMIAAAKLGKPVDLAQIPPDLSGTLKAANASAANCAGGVLSGNTLVIPVEQPAVPKHNADPKEVASLFLSIEQQLQLQINKCKYDSEYYASIGEIANVNKAEKMLQCSAVDLNVVQACRLRGELPPKMHYEQRAFTKIRVNSDLNEGECEVLVSRAINLPCADGTKPSELSTFAKWSFPWPSDSSTVGQTCLVKNTDKPVYNFKQKLPISDKKERMSRQVRRKTFDVTVLSKGGIFKSDRAIGVAQVKLDILDKKCTLHEVVQLMDPVHTRSKSTCGKIEVSVRVREPFVSKDTEDVIEKWLVVDAEPTKPIQPPKLQNSPQQTTAIASEAEAEGSSTAGKEKKRAPAENQNETDPNTLSASTKSPPKNRKKSPRPPPRAPPGGSK